MTRIALRVALGLIALAVGSAGPAPAEETVPAAAAPAEAAEPTSRPFLWRIQAESPSYLYGTIHIPDPRALALPDVVSKALEGAQVFSPEIELDAGATALVASHSLLPDGKTLRDVLPPELYQRTERFLGSRGIPIQAVERTKVLILAIQILLLDHLSLTMEPLDQLLYRRAVMAGKRVAPLEKIQDQMALLDSLSLEAQIANLRQLLEEFEKLEPGQPGPAERLLRAYLTGDEKTLMDTALGDVDLEDPASAEFLTATIDRRNVTLAEEMHRLMSAEPGASFFFAIGTAHVPGPEGVRALLEKKGYSLTRVVAE